MKCTESARGWDALLVTQHDFLCFSTNTANNCQILLDLAFCFLVHVVYYANLENEIRKSMILLLHALVTKDTNLLQRYQNSIPSYNADAYR